MKWLWFSAFPALVLAGACGDDTSGSSDAASDDGSGTADDDGSGTSPTASNTDPTNATSSDDTSADDSDDDGPSSGDGDATSSATDDTGPGPGGACDDVDDCIVVEDCCNCTVASASDPPTCDIVECRQSKCGELGFTPTAQCELGSCEPVPVPCDPGVVMCDSLPPNCNDGSFPGVDPEASCWTGDCVPADACDVVPGCADCPEGEACVQYSTQLGPLFHCSPIPEDCDGTPSCGCMSEVCVSPFDACGDGPDGVSCSCPVCG
jgi:hypothetical protein